MDEENRTDEIFSMWSKNKRNFIFSSGFTLIELMVVVAIIGVLAAFLTLVHAFLTNDFSIAYVAHNSNTALPAAYRISAVWGAHEGSLLLWILILALTSLPNFTIKKLRVLVRIDLLKTT